ncbi:PREDICTED: DNA repair protein XRCC1 [Dinoponera quadriceps]|uniref:DNA repair protein XRCC1 n=1 Tax=Dinoponera quadriceps TaxID=609295 RepID=A0A6P3XAU8_DINQU|nr:PREDICTED: DNA repair protein XRCC1 [Dinoponera quadriceps]
MIVKFEKIISYSSEHPSYPAANLLQRNSERCNTWRCAKPGEMLAHVIFQLAESSYITGVEIGNFQSCVVIVTASTTSEPDNWIVIVNHRFMTNDRASNGMFKDQVQIFTKRELNPDTMKIKFDRVKVTCMQSANMRVLFGLSYIVLRSDTAADLGLDMFGRFKLKQPHVIKTPLEMMREKLAKTEEEKKTDYKKLLEQMQKNSVESFSRSQEEKKPMKRPLLEKLEAGKADEVFGKKDKVQPPKDKKNKKETPNREAKNTEDTPKEKVVVRTPFGDIVPSKDTVKNSIKDTTKSPSNSKKRPPSEVESSSDVGYSEKKQKCAECSKELEDQPCKTCQRLSQPATVGNATPKTKHDTPVRCKKPFRELFSGVTFSLSGYVNPKRDEIRRKALNMGAKYIPDPNTTNKKCTYLICAFKNTPKYQQFKKHTKIVSHTFIEECFDKKTRFPWRRYALDQKDRSQPESEEEIDSNQPESAYDMDTDAESDY